MRSTGIVDVDEILVRVPYFADTEQLTASELSGGLTNVNYLLNADGERFVVRHSGPNATAIGIDRAVEAQAVVRASDAGIAPETIAFLLPEGHSVTRYVETVAEISFQDAKEPDHVSRMAGLLRRIHALEPINGEFDPYADIVRWRSQADERGIHYSQLAARTFDRALHVGDGRRGAYDPVLCHNDPYFMNVLDIGAYLLVDWEYAGMGDPFFDLAGVGYLLDPAGRYHLLTEYSEEPSDAHMRSLVDMIVVFLAWNVAWSLVQIDVSHIDHDYEAFAEDLLDLLP